MPCAREVHVEAVLAAGHVPGLMIVAERSSRIDPFVKYALRTADGHVVEVNGDGVGSAFDAAAGKLELGAAVRASVETQQERNALRLLAVEPAHVWALDELPGTRGDPFDRLLAAQAAHEGMILVSRDARMRALRVRTLW